MGVCTSTYFEEHKPSTKCANIKNSQCINVQEEAKGCRADDDNDD